MNCSLLILILFLPGAALAQATERPIFACPLIAKPLSIDGELDEPGWKNSKSQRLLHFDATPTELKTEFSILRSPTHLYFAFRMEDPEPHSSHDQRDDDIWWGEIIEWMIAPGEDLHTYYEFSIAPNGTEYDAKINSPNLIKATMKLDKSWNAEGMESAVKKTENGWQAEVALPIKALGKTVPKDWRFNVYRIELKPKVAYQAWSPTGGEKPDFHQPQKFGRLVWKIPGQ